MKYSKRKELSTEKLTAFIRYSLPAWCWKLKFVRSWAEGLASGIADSQAAFISKTVQEAYVRGWQSRNSVRPDERLGTFEKELRARNYAKDQGWQQ